jgi:hypothetical protein
MEKIKEFIKNNKGLSVLIVLGIILLIIITIILVEFLKERGNSEYGTRLDGINKVKISEKKLNSVEKTIKENEQVEKADVRIQGKIVYINITYKTDTELGTAKDIANGILEEFEEDELKYYDFSCFLVEQDDKDKETEEFKVTGNKHHKLDSFTYIKS